MSQPWSQALVTILGHALWQGTVVSLVAWLIVRNLERPKDRFGVLFWALMAILICPVLTYTLSRSPIIGLAVPSAYEPVLGPTVLAWLWFAGAMGRAALYATSWQQLRSVLKRHTGPASSDLALRVAKIARAFRFQGSIKVLEATAEIGPATFGVLRHVLVIPGSVISRLSPEQLDAILAHEIAHMVRDDFFVSLIQGFAESVLFFHPGVWWISGQLRRERELCCDEMAMGYVGSPLTYAEALVGVADLREPQLSMAASGGNLLARIKHLRNGPSRRKASRRNLAWLPAMALLLVFVGGAAFGAKNPQARETKTFQVLLRKPADVFVEVPSGGQIKVEPMRDYWYQTTPPPNPPNGQVQYVRVIKFVDRHGASYIQEAHVTLMREVSNNSWSYGGSSSSAESSSSSSSSSGTIVTSFE